MNQELLLRIKADAAQARDELGRFVAGAQKASEEMARAGKAAQGAAISFGFLERIGHRAFDGLLVAAKSAAGAMAGLTVDAIKAAGGFEQTQIAFTTMLGSGEKATAFLKDLERFAVKTPFEFDDLTRAAQRMKAMGFETKAILPTLSAVGDAAAGMGGGAVAVDRIVRALTQMRAKGKVNAEEMTQQLGEIIPAWEMLAESLGVSIPKAMKMAEAGMISGQQGIDAIVKGMNARYGGMMEAQSKTVLGQVSNLKDQYGFILKDFGAALLPALNQIIAGVGPLLEGFRELAKVMADNKTGIAQFVKEGLLSMVSAFTLTLEGVKHFAMGLGAMSIVILEMYGRALKAGYALEFMSKVAANPLQATKFWGELSDKIAIVDMGVQAFAIRGANQMKQFEARVTAVQNVAVKMGNAIAKASTSGVQLGMSKTQIDEAAKAAAAARALALEKAKEQQDKINKILADAHIWRQKILDDQVALDEKANNQRLKSFFDTHEKMMKAERDSAAEQKRAQDQALKGIEDMAEHFGDSVRKFREQQAGHWAAMGEDVLAFSGLLQDLGVSGSSALVSLAEITAQTMDVMARSIQSGTLSWADLAKTIGSVFKAGKEGGIGKGILSGAASGAMLGSMFGPMGTAIGAGAGALVGLIGGLFKSDPVKKAQKEAAKIFGRDINRELAQQIADQAKKTGQTIAQVAKQFREQEIKDAVAQRESIVAEAVQRLVGGTQKWAGVLAGAAEAQGRIFTASFWATVKANGLTAAVDSFKEPFAKMREAFPDIMAPLGALFDKLGEGTEFRKAADAAQGLNDTMMGLAGTGYLNVGLFNDFQAASKAAFDQAIAGGATSAEAIQTMLPFLANQAALAQKFGFELDENTKAMIAQAEAAGYSFPTDPMLAMLDVLKEIAKVLGAEIPASARAAGDALKNIPPPPNPREYGYPDTGDPVPERRGPLDSYASGTPFVPQTGMYQLHRGERVVPAAENRAPAQAQQAAVFAGPVGGDVYLDGEKVGRWMNKRTRNNTGETRTGQQSTARLGMR